ncbi:nucleotide triphosphate diphosphatase NUDT15 [Erwinia billingiae]|uniref:nucleotide triphosphate diphosphatase NUDT15 n=1 Tax=Erwinia billingiae TaxID=182337 RepID=UPI0022485E54|nr:NUDIX domain-containing protein [Erwinia billingiae]MCX0499377.1 NUDIX domain-containing protein [Erwinia billingiae]
MTQPKIGVGVLIVREGRLLLGRRRGSHGADSWSAPGGHLEFGETPEECARREVLEETGLVVGRLAKVAFTNDFFIAEKKHYVTLFMLAEDIRGTPQRCEPDKCAGWEWCSADELPQPLFAPLETLLQEGGLLPLLAGC